VNKLKFDSGSYRDPAGSVFFENKKVYRNITNFGSKKYEFIKESGLLEESIKQGFVIDTKEVNDQNLKNQLPDSKYIIEHKKIDYISYPYEWCFYQLKDAAIHHLDFQIFLLKNNAILEDCSAYNIQFIESKPIFIDVLSINKYHEGMYWNGHKQFCENFLNPLLLSSKKNIFFNNWFKGNLEGIFTSDLNSVLSLKDKFSLNVFLQVYLLDKLENRIIQNPKKTASKLKKIKPFPKNSYMSLLVQLKKMIGKLFPYKQKTVWDTYSSNNTYNKEETSFKIQVVKKFIQENSFNTIADMGCNDGLYSFESLKSGCENVIGFDFDLNSVNRAYLKAKENNSSFLPLYLDAVNPSSNLGWNENERASFKKRMNFDGMIALAFEHHLTIAKNIPLDQTLEWLTSLAPKGLIEFVPKEDETIQRMIALKGDIFPNYSEDKFKQLLEKKAKIVKIQNISSTKRKMYEYSRD
jgi:ribosomal protein L11 methylase PrmA